MEQMEAKTLSFEEMVDRVLTNVGEILVEKNKAYGNSALEPCRVFSKSSTIEQLLVRIDDKLSRIRTKGFGSSDEDAVMDLIGYLVLLVIAQGPKVTREEIERMRKIPDGWESQYQKNQNGY